MGCASAMWTLHCCADQSKMRRSWRASALRRLHVGLLCLSALHYREAEGLASRSDWYFDHDCGDGHETGTFFLGFGTFNFNTEANTSSLEPFNECYVDIGPTIVNGSSIFYTCDASTGEVSAVVYDDQECSDPRISVGGVDYCLSEDEDDDYGDACLEEEACSATEFCTNDEPSTISPNSFNVVAAQYSDDECNNPTGTDSIVSGGDVSAPGFSDEGCYPSESGGVDPAPTYPSMPFLSECLADGSVVIQAFGVSDNTCSGPVYYELYTKFTPRLSYGPDLRRTTVTDSLCYQIGDLFYRPVACTLDAVDVEGSATATPASPTTPSPAATPPPTETPTITGTPATTEIPAVTETPASRETPAPTGNNSYRDVADGLGATPAPTADGGAVVTTPRPSPSPTTSSPLRTSPSPTPGGAQPLLPDTGSTAPPSTGSAGTSATGAAARTVPGSGSGGGIGLMAAAFVCCLVAPVFP